MKKTITKNTSDFKTYYQHLKNNIMKKTLKTIIYTALFLTINNSNAQSLTPQLLGDGAWGFCGDSVELYYTCMAKYNKDINHHFIYNNTNKHLYLTEFKPNNNAFEHTDLGLFETLDLGLNYKAYYVNGILFANFNGNPSGTEELSYNYLSKFENNTWSSTPIRFDFVFGVTNNQLIGINGSLDFNDIGIYNSSTYVFSKLNYDLSELSYNPSEIFVLGNLTYKTTDENIIFPAYHLFISYNQNNEEIVDSTHVFTMYSENGKWKNSSHLKVDDLDEFNNIVLNKFNDGSKICKNNEIHIFNGTELITFSKQNIKKFIFDISSTDVNDIPTDIEADENNIYVINGNPFLSVINKKTGLTSQLVFNDYYINDSVYYVSGNRELLFFENNKLHYIDDANGTYIENTFGPFYKQCKTSNGVKLLKISDFVLINGVVYVDINNNKTYDKGEEFSSNTKLHFTSNGIDRTIITNGNFTFGSLSNQEWSIEPILDKNYVKDYSGTIKTTPTENSNPFIEIPIKTATQIFDLSATISSSRGYKLRKGIKNTFYLKVKNTGGKTTGSSNLNFKTSKSLDIISTSQNYTVNNQNMIFKIGKLNINESKTIEIVCYTNPNNFEVNDKFNLNISIDSIFNENDTIIQDENDNNNNDSIDIIIIGPIDPNEKTCIPSGVITEQVNEIRYNIQFENMGTDTAYNVWIIDSLDLNLPAYEIELLNSSHPYTLDITNNVITWKFINIMLPDSGTNKLGSMGFVNFKAKINSNWGAGIPINNTAYIKFDYEKPIKSNLASVVWMPKTSNNSIENNHSKVLIYPNPNNGILNIENLPNETNVLYLFNIHGQKIATFNVEGTFTSLNTENLIPGLYLIKTNNNQIIKFIKE